MKMVARYEDLDLNAKANCVEQYMNIICPYEDFEGESLDEVGENVNYWIGDQFSVDENGNWYDEGRMIADF